MNIFKIQVENYRLLQNFSIDLESSLSLVVGKNNTGKTSFLKILEKFLGPGDKARFSIDDFNIDFKKSLKALIEADELPEETGFRSLGIRLNLFIEYDEKDNLANISRVMMDLDPDNNVVVLGFEYTLNHLDFSKLKAGYIEFKGKENIKNVARPEYERRGLHDFLNDNQAKFFKIRKSTIAYDPVNKSLIPDNFINIDETVSIKDIISFKHISAKRDVTNKDVDKTLSEQTSRIYEATEQSDEQNKAVEGFKDQLSETDSHLTGIYKTLFDGIIKKIRDFGGVKVNESAIDIISTLKHRELLKGNTTVVYKHDTDSLLPEHYNGLGYMNLISMIFEIEILVHEFKREKDKNPSDINFLFIEEPEAHTHPQMQYIFIKNIKDLLKDGINRDDGQHRELQYVISTHSSSIVADSDFDDIKYLKKESPNSSIAKNLSDLKAEYDGDPKQYKFLTQYLTISRAEIFFAEKAILIEGDTERILIPTLMRKIDMEEKDLFRNLDTEDSDLPLLSQNISVIEVGAYSQIFEKFIDFLGIKSLVITDIDSVDAGDVACPVAVGISYSNEAIRFFFNEPTLDDLKGFPLANKIFNKSDNSWTNDENGMLGIVYQTLENGYYPRSFEDAFININRDFINVSKVSFRGLKNRHEFDNHDNDPYDLADSCIKKKTHFALDIIYHSNEELNNWQIPAYIKEGLLWLKKD